MEASDIPINERQGQTVRRSWQFLDETGTPMDWGGYTARMHVRTGSKPGDDGTPTLALTTENGGITLQNHGWMEIYVSDIVMSAVDIANYVYDVEWIAPNGDVLCPMFGKFKVKGEVTR